MHHFYVASLTVYIRESASSGWPRDGRGWLRRGPRRLLRLPRASGGDLRQARLPGRARATPLRLFMLWIPIAVHPSAISKCFAALFATTCLSRPSVPLLVVLPPLPRAAIEGTAASRRSRQSCASSSGTRPPSTASWIMRNTSRPPGQCLLTARNMS